MATQHIFAPFNPPGETWESYVARFESFLIANAYTELSGDRKRAYFLGFCGTEMFETARALFAPASIHSVSWEDFLAKLKEHYAPTPSRCARRYAFFHRDQAEHESINQYVAALRRAALYCEFYDLEDYLLDRLVFGVRDCRLKRRLLAMHGLTFQAALTEARAAELSSQSLAEMEGGANSTPTVHTNAVGTLPEELETKLSLEEEVCRLKGQQFKAAQKPRQAQFFNKCMGCGGDHFRATCNFREAVCRRCGRKGHIARVCRAGHSPFDQQYREPAVPQRWGQQRGPAGGRSDCFAIHHSHRISPVFIRNTSFSPVKKISVTVQLGRSPCSMEVDTGSAMSLVSWSTIKHIFPRLSKRSLDYTPLSLRDYQGGRIPVVGRGLFPVKYKEFSGKLPLIIVDGPFTSLLGLDWFSELGFKLEGIHSIQGDNIGDMLAREFPSVFDGQLGKYVGTPVGFSLDPLVAPIRLKPRRVPFALRSKVDAEIDKLLAQGILEPVDQARWETPIVMAIKPDGSLRLCADYKCTINRALPPHAYPVPIVQHLLHSLGGGKLFAKLDLSQAYQQLPVDKEAADAQTITTHRGAFRCHRLQFGISSAPGIFQSLMERLLQGIPGTVPYFDDVLVTAQTQPELLSRVRSVLSKFQEVGLRVKKSKCTFMAPSVEFLGFLVDASGIHPTPSKTKAIRDAPTPKSKAELQAFLGLLNFYAIFLPHKATVAEPLHRLLDSGRPWIWGRREAQALEAVKQLLTENTVLSQYSDSLPLILACDASPYGVGAVLSHRLPSGREAPIAFFSRTLAGPERNYGQIDKEALALVAGVRKFHHYLYGRSFDLVTDHQPLLGLLAGDKSSPQVMSPRMTRWTIFLANYTYRLHYRPGRNIAHADALSRCPLPALLEDPAPASTVLSISELAIPLNAADIARAIAKDSVLSTVVRWVLRGWPKERVPPEFAPFTVRKSEFSVMRGCLLWGERVVIPQQFQKRILDSLHFGHPGIVRMKALARGYVWWPGLDKAIEHRVASCVPCQESRSAPPKAQPREWESPASPWSRLHIDLAGPVQGQMFLIVVDAFSKWLEVCQMGVTTSEAVIRSLMSLFATHGFPDLIISDNGPQFTSVQFEGYLASIGVRHGLIAPWHPASNGMAERMVRTTKDALQRIRPGGWHQKITELLLSQHSTPCVSTHKTPAELLMGRKLRITLDRLHPQFTPVTHWDSSRPKRAFTSGDLIYARNFAGHPTWLPGKVTECCGPCSYRITLSDGREWHRHVDQLRSRVGEYNTGNSEHGTQNAPSLAEATRNIPSPAKTVPTRETATNADVSDFQSGDEAGTSRMGDTPEGGPGIDEEGEGPLETVPPELRRSNRSRKRPAYLADYACTIRRGKGCSVSASN